MTIISFGICKTIENKLGNLIIILQSFEEKLQAFHDKLEQTQKAMEPFNGFCST
jgi:hypothetical protein